MAVDVRISQLQQAMQSLSPQSPYEQVFAIMMSIGRDLFATDGMVLVLSTPAGATSGASR